MDSCPLIAITGQVTQAMIGRGAFQETSSYAPSVAGMFQSGSVFHHAAVIEHPAELSLAAVKLRRWPSALRVTRC